MYGLNQGADGFQRDLTICYFKDDSFTNRNKRQIAYAYDLMKKEKRIHLTDRSSYPISTKEILKHDDFLLGNSGYILTSS